MDGVPDAADTLIATWMKTKYGEKDVREAKTRADAARRCMSNNTVVPSKKRLENEGEEGKPRSLTDAESQQKSDCKHLDKMRAEVRNAYYARQLDQHTNETTGEVTGAGAAFLRAQYLTTAGADSECVNDKRGLSENIQKVGLRNAEIDTNVAHAKFYRSERPTTEEGVTQWATTVSVEGVNEDGTRNPDDVRATINAERNTFKVKTGSAPDLYNQIWEEDTEAEIEERVKKSLKTQRAAFKKKEDRDWTQDEEKEAHDKARKKDDEKVAQTKKDEEERKAKEDTELKKAKGRKKWTPDQEDIWRGRYRKQERATAAKGKASAKKRKEDKKQATSEVKDDIAKLEKKGGDLPWRSGKAKKGDDRPTKTAYTKQQVALKLGEEVSDNIKKELLMNVLYNQYKLFETLF